MPSRQPDVVLLVAKHHPYGARVGRAIALDLIRMGKSDKSKIEYRFFDHAAVKQAGVLVRPAVPSDLRGVWDILYEIEYGDGEHGPDPAEIPALFEHELTTGEMWVAEADAAVVGYAA